MPHGFHLDDNEMVHGFLGYDPTIPILGQGAFKTAQRAELSLSSRTSSGLGESGSLEAVALKRPYYFKPKSVMSTSQATVPRRYRFSVRQELEKIVCEANILCWASSLLEMSYDYIDAAINTRSYRPPFEIPRLRFVRGGIAMAQKGVTSGRGALTTVRAGYLLEELLPLSDVRFQKYVNNAQAIPLSHPGEAGHEIGLFCCFLQHLQYNITSESAYISDFQGTLFSLYVLT